VGSGKLGIDCEMHSLEFGSMDGCNGAVARTASWFAPSQDKKHDKSILSHPKQSLSQSRPYLPESCTIEPLPLRCRNVPIGIVRIPVHLGLAPATLEQRFDITSSTCRFHSIHRIQ
jgi:hypothetical protein